MSSCAQSGKNVKCRSLKLNDCLFDSITVLNLSEKGIYRFYLNSAGTQYLITAYQAPSQVWRHPCISGYGGQRLPNVTQRDLNLPQARFHSALVPDCATSLKKSPVNCDPGCPTSELCSAPEPLVPPGDPSVLLTCSRSRLCKPRLAITCC